MSTSPFDINKSTDNPPRWYDELLAGPVLLLGMAVLVVRTLWRTTRAPKK